MGVQYDPEWVEYTKTHGGAPAQDPNASIEERKALFNDWMVGMAAQLPPTDPGITIRNIEFKEPPKGKEVINSNIKMRIYTPPKSEGKLLPVVVYIHGGGWFAGDLETEDHTCRMLCAGIEGGCVVVSTDYRKGPMFRFPAPVQDCFAAYQWISKNIADLGGDPERQPVLVGGSAGGGLAIAVTYRLLKEGFPKPRGLLTMQPFALHPDACPKEYKHLHTAYTDNANAAFIPSAAAMQAFQMMDVVPPYSKGQSHWFPLSLGSDGVRDFPRTWIINTDEECIRDDGRVFEAELRDAGVEVRREVIEGLPHYFWHFPLVEAGRMFRRRLIGGLGWILEE